MENSPMLSIYPNLKVLVWNNCSGRTTEKTLIRKTEE
uniref:Uncharacterized protein n=1 Tax=Arundo donax TaxID=35708 RepID=A0A0A9AVZ3_ARUDO